MNTNEYNQKLPLQGVSTQLTTPPLGGRGASLIIISAPSGAGKSTLVKHLLTQNLGLEFSVSATCRQARGKEQHGKDYYFISEEEFKQKIDSNDFIEYEEVYAGCYYGTLRSEVDRISEKGHTVIFDVDVVGGLNIKKQYPKQSISIFIAPPSVDALRERLHTRSTDTPEMIEKRVGKATLELAYAPQFDVIIVNDELEKAKLDIEIVVRKFLNK